MRVHALCTIILAASAPTSHAQIQLEGPGAIPISESPRATDLADLDGDGDFDLIATASTPDRVELRFNDGQGVFAPGPTLLVPVGSQPCTPVAADLDGDGDLDIAVTLQLLDRVDVFENTALGFQLVTSFAVPGQATRLAAGDLDGDGDFDLAAVGSFSSSVTIAINAGSFQFAPTPHAVPMSVRELIIADLTQDGLLDVAVTSISGDVLTILVSQGNGAFAPIAIPLGGFVGHALAAGDVDGDGDCDLVTAGGGSISFLVVVENLGASVFQPQPVNFIGGGGIGNAVLADVDLDGDLDFTLASQIASSLIVLENDGPGTFTNAHFFSPGTSIGHVAMGDVNGDGSPDSVVTAPFSAELLVYTSVANGTPCAVTSYCTAKLNSLGLLAAAGGASLPSLATQGFSVHMTDAVPNVLTLAFFSTNGPANQPLFGGTLCLAPPFQRLPVRTTGPSGSVSYAVHVTHDLLGSTRNYQFFYRDPAHPDGTGVGLSDGVEVIFCN